MPGWQEFAGLNRGYVLELYEKYRQDPQSVDEATRQILEQWTPPADDSVPSAEASVPLHKVVGAVPRLVSAAQP